MKITRIDLTPKPLTFGDIRTHTAFRWEVASADGLLFIKLSEEAALRFGSDEHPQIVYPGGPQLYWVVVPVVIKAVEYTDA